MISNNSSSYILVILLLAFGNSAIGQKCLSTEKRLQSLNQNPTIQNNIDEINHFTDSWIQNFSSTVVHRNVLTIPVVVHVIFKDDIQNISEDQVKSQIDVLNADFRKMNENFNETQEPFKNRAADVEIEFCLVKVDSTGSESTGITYQQTDVDRIGTTDFWYQSDNGGTDAWNPEKYLNIWVCDLGGDGILGFASMPGTAEPMQSDGVVIDYRHFGTIGTATNSQPYHLGRITTHEVGHYLNLEHLWGFDTGGCDQDDFVEDTPNQNSFSEDCPSFPSYDDCTNEGIGLNFNNFMDYTDDSCMTMFTEGQKLRMLATLSGPRANLVQMSACMGPSEADEIKFEDHRLIVWPNPVDHYLKLGGLESVDYNHYIVFDVTGKRININSNQRGIDVSALESGIYFIVTKDRNRRVAKFVVQH